MFMEVLSFSSKLWTIGIIPCWLETLKNIVRLKSWEKHTNKQQQKSDIALKVTQGLLEFPIKKVQVR